jgi:hypothetical protein
MHANPLRPRGAALEDDWFRQNEEHARRHLRQSRQERTRHVSLARELGVDDAGLLARLAALGVTAETAPAFEALPLVEVAWADGDVDREERWRVLTLATAFGLELGRPAHAQLELWLRERPAGELFDAWRAFAARLGRRHDARARVRRVVEGAEEVAAAAGGLFGLRAVSGAERSTIEEIRAALAPAS